MTKTEAKYRIKHGSWSEVFDALEFLRKHTSPRDIEDLASAFNRCRDTTLRILLVELIGHITSDKVKSFLTQVARSRAQYLVRYYAMRCLIDLGYESWRPPGKLPNTDYYASLSAYESYVSGKMTLANLQGLATSKTQWNGDHWFWLTQLEAGYLDRLKRHPPPSKK